MTGETFWGSGSTFQAMIGGGTVAEKFVSYQRAYVDFFEDRVVDFGYDWGQMLEHYLYEGKEPLIHSMISGCMSIVSHF